MYYDFFQQHKRRIQIAGIAFVILIIIWGVTTYVARHGKVPVVVSVVPSSATVTFNGQHEGNGTHWLQAGSYTVTVKKDGFTSQTEKITVTGEKEQNVVAVSLVAESGEAKKWAADHQQDYKKNEAYGSIQANSDGKYFTAKNPITTKLPYNDPYFTIGYVANTDQSVTLTVQTPSPRYRFYAVEQIRKLGYDPTDFKIEFKDFHNPLEERTGATNES